MAIGDDGDGIGGERGEWRRRGTERVRRVNNSAGGGGGGRVGGDPTSHRIGGSIRGVPKDSEEGIPQPRASFPAHASPHGGPT